MKLWSFLIVGFFLWNLVQAQDLFIKKAKDKTVVPWAVTDWPPFYIMKGPHKGDGRLDQMKRIVAANSPDMEFKDVYADIGRTIELLKMNKNICTGSLLKTPEREKYAYFTALTFQVPHDYVIVTARPELLKGAAEPVSLRTFLENPQWHGVFPVSRSYGSEVDPLIATAASRNPRVSLVTTSEGYMAILKMVQKKRYDYTVEYEHVARFFNESIIPDKPLLVKTLKETLSSPVFYFACTKNDWGRKTVLKVDGVLRKVAGTKDYQNAVESWMVPEMVKKHRKALDDFYQRRAQQEWHTVSDESLLDL